MRNLALYAKGKADKRFNAIGSLQKMTYAPNLMYAALIPEDKLERLKEFCNELSKIDNSVKLQIREVGTSKVIYSV